MATEETRIAGQPAQSGAQPAAARRPMGVRGTLMLLVLAIVLPFLLLAALGAQRNLRDEQLAAEERALTRARLLSARVDDLVGGVDGLLLALTETLSADPADTALNTARLASIGARLPAVYSQIRVSTADGAAIGHSNGASPDISGRKYFRDALAKPGMAIGEPARSFRTGAWTVGFARAIRDPAGQVRAVVSITLRLERLHEILDNRGLPDGSTIFLVSERGIVLARSEDQDKWIGQDVSKRPTGMRAMQLRDGAEIIQTAERIERLTGFGVAKKIPWVAVVASPTEEAFADVRAAWQRNLLLFAIALAFALVAGSLAARRLVRPIRRITADAVVFGAGDLAHRSNVTTPAEMGVLARTFNSLAEDVAARTASLQESEARYRMMFESNPQPMWVFDRETFYFLAVNDAAIEHYGYSRQEFLAMKVTDMRPAEERGRFLRFVDDRSVGVRSVGLWKHVRRDGSVIDVEISSHDMIFDGRPALHSLAVDVTERLRMEQEIRSLNFDLEERVRARTAELSATNRELESFTYSVSHDLRNPLRAIDGFSKLLLDQHTGGLDAEGAGYLARIRAAAQRMGLLITDLLNLSRVSRGTLHKTQVDLSALAWQVAEELRELAPERTVEWRIAPGLSAWADASLMRSVLDNLLGNAWKYTRKVEHAVIEFGLRDGAAAPGYAEFFVRDNGAGFDMAYAAKLFAVFQRLHSPHEFEGTGVGLATVQRIVERHGGQVRGEGSPGQGACILFSLPPQGQGS